jgi:hypothetical protein
MTDLAGFAFGVPWVLMALALLPALWWLMRLTPPAPRRVRFPALYLLRDVMVGEETPAKLPWWLLLLRFLLAGCVILALAGPILNPSAALPGSGPLILVVDTGWAAAADWPARQASLDDLLARAEREQRPVVLVATAGLAGEEGPLVVGPVAAEVARRRAEALAPQPWAADRSAVAALIRDLRLGGSSPVVWLADGLVEGPQGAEQAQRFATTMQRLGGLGVLAPADDVLPVVIRAVRSEASDLVVVLERAETDGEAMVTVQGVAADGRPLVREPARFADAARQAELRLTLPVEVRNQIVRLAVEAGTRGALTAGGTLLLDGGSRRRLVGLVRADRAAQPLLSDGYYLERALAPFGELIVAPLADVLAGPASTVILGDINGLTESQLTSTEQWIEKGGVLVRFGGALMARSDDGLTPVRLRRGERQLSGALSWSEPAKLAPFAPDSPFAGITIPADVTVSRQVLAEPALDLDEHTWARLADGTPLVTAERRGRGWLVLVHTTAQPAWSNLALSGLFVEMLHKLVALSDGTLAAPPDVPLEPDTVLDGFARLVPAGNAFPLAGEALRATRPGPRHPPGYYAAGEARFALNLAPTLGVLAPLPDLPSGVVRSGYGRAGEIPLAGLLLGLALALATLDVAAMLAIKGVLKRRGTGGWRGPSVASIALAVLLAGLSMAEPARANDAMAIQVTHKAHLAYVLTGDAEADRTSEQGLNGLARLLSERTALDELGVIGIDVEQDELAFYPLLYWPVTDSSAALGDFARQRVNNYLRFGGTILFDTRDADASFSGTRARALRRLVDGLPVQPLVTVPPDHVLGRAFYLLTEFPGRNAEGALWVETREDSDNDGVSSIIIGANDYAAAWAIDQFGQPLNAIVPGGELQREQAFRFGVNLVMYTLTGNYKADQVHVPAILERLGQ